MQLMVKLKMILHCLSKNEKSVISAEIIQGQAFLTIVKLSNL